MDTAGFFFAMGFAACGLAAFLAAGAARCLAGGLAPAEDLPPLAAFTAGLGLAVAAGFFEADRAG